MLEKKKPRLSLTGAIVILSICILFSSFSISSAIRNVKETDHGTYEYELQKFNDNFEELIKTLQENNKVGP